MAVMGEDRSEIAFFDLETTVPTRTRQGFAILEFGAILVCPRKLVELRSYSTLVRPADLSRITSLSVRCNGITREAVMSAPTFADIADVVYDLLHGRIWAGHNILRFDCARLREAFAEIGRQAPEPRGTIDSLALLTQRFGRRAGDMKMASLATYFGLGQQTHRSLDDVRMNLEVLKYCATVLFLESSLPDHFPENSWVSPNATTRSRANGKSPTEHTVQNVECHPTRASRHHTVEENHPILSLMAPENGETNPPIAESSSVRPDPLSGMGILGDGLEDEPPLADDNMEEEKTESTPVDNYQHSRDSDDFLKPDDISESSMSVKLINFYRGSSKIQILYQDLPLQLQSMSLKVRFGVSSKFVDHAGRPRLSFVVDAPSSLCRILDKADSLAHEMSVDCSSTSEWRPVVNRKPGFYNYPNIRLQLPFVTDGENTRWATEVYQKDGSSLQRLVFSRFDVGELECLLAPGDLIDASFSLDAYDYLQNAGIRLMTKKLVLHSKQ